MLPKEEKAREDLLHVEEKRMKKKKNNTESFYNLNKHLNSTLLKKELSRVRGRLNLLVLLFQILKKILMMYKMKLLVMATWSMHTKKLKQIISWMRQHLLILK